MDILAKTSGQTKQRTTSGDPDAEFYCWLLATVAVIGAVAGTVPTGGVRFIVGALVVAAAGAPCVHAAAD